MADPDSVDERTVGHEVGSGSARPASVPIATLGRQLAELELVDVTTFDGICQTVGSLDSEPVVSRLEQVGKLTAFQAKRIREGSADALRFDEYVLTDKLGEGGMGEVYKAHNLMLGRQEAIKTIVNLEGAEAALLRRFEQEAKVLARLEHSAIVPIYKVGNFQGTKYIAMKFVEGDDLRHKVKEAKESGKPIPLTTACNWISQAADALAYAHRQNVIHRDIKPGNLMITKGTDRLIILDMGIARLADPQTPQGEGLTVQSRGLGTPEFMPPEQWADARAVTPAADIYALGVTLFYLLTGRVPFKTARMVDLMRAHATEPVPKVSGIRDDVPPEIDPIIAKMMAKNPEDRYHTGTEVVAALQPFIDDRIAERTPWSIPHIKSMDVGIAKTVLASDVKPSRLPLISIVVAVLVLLGGAGGWWIYSSDAENPARVADVVTVIDDTKETAPPVSTVTKQDAPPWLVEYQRTHAEHWPSIDELMQKVTELAGTTGVSDPSLGGAQGALAKETTNRVRRKNRAQLVDWLKEFQSAHAAAWPKFDDLESAAGGLAVMNRIESDDQLAEIRNLIRLKTASLESPFENLRPGEFTQDWIDDATGALKQILGIFNTPRDPNWKFEAEFVDDADRPVSRVKAGEGVHPMFTSSRDAFVTIVAIDAWTLSILRIGGKATAGDTVIVSEQDFKFTQPGLKRFYVVATPKPLVQVNITPIINSTDRAVEQLFADEHVYARIIDSLATGAPMPGVPTNPEIESWALQVMELTVLP